MEIIPVLVLFTLVYLAWLVYRRWVLARNPGPVELTGETVRRWIEEDKKKCHARFPPGRVCACDPGITREYVSRRLAECKAVIREAEDLVLELERGEFEVAALRRLVQAALLIVSDVESRMSHKDYAYQAILVNSARHKAGFALTSCRYFNRATGEIEVPREPDTGDAHCACSGL